MKKIINILQRARSIGHRAESREQRAGSTGQRAQGRELRAESRGQGAIRRLGDWMTERLSDRETERLSDRETERLSDCATERRGDPVKRPESFEPLCLCVFVLIVRHKIIRHKTQDRGILSMTNDHYPMINDFVLIVRHKIFRHKTQDQEILSMTNDHYPMINDFKLVTKKPQQVTLHGSRYKSNSQLPREGFNSGVCPAAAAITRKRSTNSSPRATLPGGIFHPQYKTHFGQNGSPQWWSRYHRNIIREGLPMG